MAVYHVLKDGSRPKDITGHVVRLEDDGPLRRVIENISRRAAESKANTYVKPERRKKHEHHLHRTNHSRHCQSER